MKNYQSTQEGIWHEILDVELTNQQKEILNSFTIDPDSIASRKEIMDMVKELSEGPVSPQKEDELIALYSSKKPEVPEGQSYQLISMDVSEDDSGGFTGILNCRVNGDHIQVRF
jgi:hypothetical protein